LLENLPRVLPDGCSARIETSSWEWPEVFRWLQSQGNVAPREMYRTFNCGVGMVACVADENAADAVALLEAAGHRAWEIGRTAAGNRQVDLLP
jgi:phosphoribosylformylglycinamidine cyclo-ligase